MRRFIGKWVLEKCSGLPELLKQLGLDKKHFDSVESMKNIIEFSEVAEGQYKYFYENNIQDGEVVFYLGKDFQVGTPDNHVLKSTITIDKGVMKLEQSRDGIKIVTLRTIENGKMKTVVKFGDHECELLYKKV
ncbi:unnamed protein product [Rodentolepis nana]|uniref:Lipocln_cytosolic_FA-bd_dom domain-containing protein n=1 Tax=Rodentolepis nana TaxID=102285 RepID=A0A0R3TZV1_RODNA|nr:unnamed protein product [Rodentolepis nana]